MKTAQAFHVLTNNTHKQVKPEKGRAFKLAELQRFVGGYIEIVEIDKDNIMVINEEGKLKGLPFNMVATLMLRNNPIYAKEVVVGDVLICAKGMVK